MIDANSQFFAILTNVGMAKQANADALGIPWLITQMGVGDANPNGLADPPNPLPAAGQTKLLNEWRRKPLNQLKIDPVNPAVIIAEQIIPADEGGKWIREIGLYDADGDLVAVANCAPSFKPLLSQGSGRTQIVRINFVVTSTGNIQLKIDPAIVLASRAYVDAAILEVLPKNKAAGQYTRVKVNDRGVVVSGDNPETLAGMGIKDTYTKTEIEAMIAQASALPVGATVAFPLDKVAPGFLELDGSVRSIAVYPDLAAFLGTAFNKGDEGVGNFRLPESRGEFLRGWDHGRGVDAGRVIGSFQADALKTHFHYLPTESGGNQASDPAGINPTSVLKDNPVDWLARTLGDNPTFNTLGNPRTYSAGAEVETRPRNLAVVWCVKAWNAPINQGSIDIAALAALATQATEIKLGTAKIAMQADAELGVNNDKIMTPLRVAQAVAPARRLALFTTNGSWLCPDGVTEILLNGCGGGAGGSGANGTANAGEGGGAGNWVFDRVLSVVPGQTYTVTIGNGGNGGALNADGSGGGATSFGALLTLGGGIQGSKNGQGAGSGSGSGGAGGDAFALGGAGGSGFFGNGGASRIASGANGTGYGSGGAGGAPGWAGGNGAKGFIQIKW